MKTIITNYDEAMELVHQIAQFDPMSIEIIICMTIDTESATYKESVGDILDRIITAMHAVNDELGPYVFEGNVMIIKIKHNLISNTFYVYKSPTPTKRVSVELRKRRTKAMLEFMTKAKIKVDGNYITYT